MAKRRALKDLNLLDRFLFAEAMEDPVIMQNMLEIILGRDILLKLPPQSEKEKRRSPLFRYIRLDVLGIDEENTVYDTEVQRENTHNLPRRSRLYQSLIDARLLEPGETDFNRMNNVYVIMIAPFDLFGKGQYRYTFRMRCDGDEGMSLEDGAVRIFLNTRGTDPKGVSPELIELLRYIEHTTQEVSDTCKSGKIREMQKRIARIKENEEIGVKYMQAWEEKVYERIAGRKEGLQEGLSNGRAQGLQEGLFFLIYKKLARGYTLQETADSLEEEPASLQEMYEFLKSGNFPTPEEGWMAWMEQKGWNDIE